MPDERDVNFHTTPNACMICCVMKVYYNEIFQSYNSNSSI